MIAVDASAVLAIILEQPDQDHMLLTLKAAGGGMFSPVNWWEVAVRARTLKGGQGLAIVETILRRLNVRIAPIDEAQAHSAFDADIRFGRGTPAALNLGDCFAYAPAAAEGGGLLFKGADFPKTDIRSAL